MVVHGEARSGKRTKLYTCWRNMLNRCYQSSVEKFKDYGARGITVCERWHSYENFVSDMGRPPTKDHSIERLKVNGNYEPGNCVWLPVKKQARNRRSTRYIEFKGETKPMAQWAEEYGISNFMLYKRLKCGWNIEAALTTKRREAVHTKPMGPRR